MDRKERKLSRRKERRLKASTEENPEQSTRSHRKSKRSKQPSEPSALRKDLGIVKQCLRSVANTSLNHMHDHLIATLPPEMSLYYQKLHDNFMPDRTTSSPVSTTMSTSSTSTMTSTTASTSSTTISSSTTIPASNIYPDLLSDQLSEMHEFIPNFTSIDNVPSVHTTQYIYNPYLPPPRTYSNILPEISQYFGAFNRVGSLVPNLLNVNYFQGSRPPGTAERVVQRESSADANNVDDMIPIPPPVLPLINCTHPHTRLPELTLEEFESTNWSKNSLLYYVFKGGISDDKKLRTRIWPTLLSMCPESETNTDYKLHEFDWAEKQKLFEHYSNQWKSILPEQEKRFTLFREQKSLIERDVVRCDRTHPFYKGDSENLDKLKCLLLTYLMYDFDTGYVQGMSDLASPLLYATDGDVCKAFWFFVQIMQFTRRNFEMSQRTIKLQLSMLWKLVEITDPIFAQYLVNKDSMNCFFAFSWIVCQFKRILMNNNNDDYHQVLLLWETIWTCSAMRDYYMDLKQLDVIDGLLMKQTSSTNNEASTSNNNNVKSSSPTVMSMKELAKAEEEKDLIESLNNNVKLDDSGDKVQDVESINDNKSVPDDQSNEEDCDTNKATYGSDSSLNRNPQVLNIGNVSPLKLSDTELYVLCICLAIIRRERDLIMANRFDATDILKHFNKLELNNDLKNILIHAANIWSWLIYDGKEQLLYTDGETSVSVTSGDSTTPSGSNAPANTSGSGEDFDLLNELRIAPNSSDAENYFIMSSP